MLRPRELIRIVSINDIYDIQNFPAFAALLKEVRATPAKTITVVNGDFLSPNALSPLDSGRSMIDCFNRLAVDYCCLGNHEGDLGLKVLRKRALEFKGVVVCSNVPGLIAGGQNPIRPWGITTTPMGRRIGVLGLLLDEPGAFRDGTFKGHSIEPVVDSARAYAQVLREEQQTDLVLPLTHQSMPSDERLSAAGLDFPLILGGHEHELMLRNTSEALRKNYQIAAETLPRTTLVSRSDPASSIIVKTGQSCEHAAICDIEFPEDTAQAGGGEGVSVSVYFEDVVSRAEQGRVCAEMDQAVSAHLAILNTLRHEVVVWLRESEEHLLPFSSVGTRLRASSVAALLCEACRKVVDF